MERKDKVKLTTDHRKDGYWITGFPKVGYQDVGPYPTKTEAEEHRVSLQRTMDNWDNDKFWTVDTAKKILD
jgi:hypothetical protein